MPTNYLMSGARSAALQDAQALENSKTQNALYKAQLERTNAIAQREQRQYDDAQRMENTQWLASAAEQALQNPGSIPSFVMEGKRRGVIDQSFSGNVGPNELSMIIKGAKTALGGAPMEDRSSLPAGYDEFDRLVRDAEGTGPRAEAARIRLGQQSRAGQLRVLDIGGVPTITGTGADGQPVSIPVSTLPAEMQAKFGLANAAQAGTEAAETAAIPNRMRTEAETQAQIDAPQREQAILSSMNSVDNTMALIDEALGGVSGWTVGPIGAVLEKWPGTGAADLQATVDTIVANLSFDRLQQMRESSKTGGALGNVSERELGLLGSAVASLSNAQSPEQMVYHLRRVQKHYAAIKQQMQGQLNRQREIQGTQPQSVTIQYDAQGNRIQ